MKVSEIGEFALIDLIKETIEQGQKRGLASRQRVMAGIGDDAAVWRSRDGLTIATTDTVVEHVHFERHWSTFEDLGWKALAISLSDIAAMGGNPQHCLVSLCMTASTQAEEITALYRGMLDLANRHDVVLVGGNVARASELSITTTVLGTAGEAVLRRSTARAGELVAVTGYPGLSAAGLRFVSKQPARKKTHALLREAFLRPQPRLAEARALLECGVKTAIDVSDGILSDLSHICRASGVGAVVEASKVPLHPQLKRAFPDEGLKLALSGGEDYELLVTAPQEALDRAKKVISTPLTVIGRVKAGTGQVSVVDERGKPLPPDGKGWDHFRGH